MEMNRVDTQRVVQIGIVVRDLDAKVKAWSAFLGTEPAWTGETGPVEETHATYMGNLTQARCRQAIFDLGECSLELIEPIGQPSTWTDFLEDRGEGLHHIAFRVDGMAEGVRRVEASGNPLVQRGEFPNGRYAYLDAAATLGTLVELLELDAPRSSTS
jgi:catechol 2,3-dioxygenase-like lactoylglutathione lyase family enzyme